MNDQPNPIDAAIAELLARRDQIDQLIQGLKAFKEGASISMPSFGTPTGIPPGGAEMTSPVPPGTFHGMGIEEATRHLLKARKRTLSAQEIANDLREGGLHLQSETPANTIASVLSRAYGKGGDIVRVSRGQWGLQEWYPTRRFDRGGED